MTDKPRIGPRPFPYDRARPGWAGAFSLMVMATESEHIALGKPDWAPMLYALCAELPATNRCCGPLARLMNLTGMTDVLACLEDWQTRDANVKLAWAERLAADGALFEPVRQALSRQAYTGAQRAWLNHLYTVCPPHQGIVLEAPREYIAWQRSEPNMAWRDACARRFDWLQEQVAREFRAAGFEVEGALFRMPGFEPLYHDDWNALDF